MTGYSDGTDSYTITSDASGNITSISNGTDSVSHTWLGRILQSATIAEDGVTTTATYTYNAEGQRIKKVVGDNVTNYYYNGDILAGLSIDGVTMTFRYDENGVPFSFIYGETEYFYVRNLQGDVAYIVNDFGHIMGYYTYDAWGNVTELYGDIAEINPIRYRGYVYDAETGYYYLNSRYYDPELCRFISADGFVSTGQGVLGYNMFAYCCNNPVIFADDTGTAAHLVIQVAVNDGGGGLRPIKKGRSSTKEQKTENKTTVFGINLSGAVGVSGSLSIGLAVDNEGHVGVVASFSAGGGTPNLSGSIFVQQTNAPDIYSLSGVSTQVGGSVDAGIANLGYEFSMFTPTSQDVVYHGHTFELGLGVPVIPIELHGGTSHSWVWSHPWYDIHDYLETISELILTQR